MKKTVAIIMVLLLVTVALSSCKTTENNQEKTDDSVLPQFFNDIGKTLNVLKKEQPGSKIITSLDSIPNSAAAGLAEPEGNYVHFFFTTQDGDIEVAMDKCGEQLKCAGFLTTVGTLFPAMKDEMSFTDFFSLIGVSEYQYFSDIGEGQGYLNFSYNNMNVWLNSNEYTSDGGWKFTGAERIKKSAPVAIYDKEISIQNAKFADEVMYE